MKILFAACVAAVALMTAAAEAQSPLAADIDRRAAQIESKVVAWRRDIHQNPELGNREFRTSKIVADHLRSLGIEVRTGVAHTGVVGLIVGGKPGPVVALRADMDALPVTEQVNVAFASKARSQYNGQEVGVMHACGHDNHVAILMGVAEILAGMKAQLPGTVKFIFQPAEEGAPAGEEGGARLMIREGVLENPRPAAIFGLHVMGSAGDVGKIEYRGGGAMASSDMLKISVRGRQTHGALPWAGIDPVVTASQIVLGLQTIVSRQVDTTKTPAVITVGTIRGGTRYNIIPDEVIMEGTIRAFDSEIQEEMHRRIKMTAESIAAAAGAEARVEISRYAPVTFNNPALTERMLPTLRRIAGDSNVSMAQQTTTAEDFAYFQQNIPGFYFFLGSRPKGIDPLTAPANHSPLFAVDEGVLPLGVRIMAHIAADYLSQK
jgi:amidohydrolase